LDQIYPSKPTNTSIYYTHTQLSLPGHFHQSYSDTRIKMWYTLKIKSQSSSFHWRCRQNKFKLSSDILA